MDRLEKIRNAVKAKEEKEKQEALEASQKENNLFDKLKSLLPRVQELCKLIRELDKNKLLKEHESANNYGKDFFTDGISHRIGFSYVHNASTWLDLGYEHLGLFSWDDGKDNHNKPRVGAIGSEGGGWSNYNVVLTEDGKVLYNGKDYISTMEWIVKDFDKFEKRVFDFIDNLEG